MVVAKNNHALSTTCLTNNPYEVRGQILHLRKERQTSSTGVPLHSEAFNARSSDETPTGFDNVYLGVVSLRKCEILRKTRLRKTLSTPVCVL